MKSAKDKTVSRGQRADSSRRWRPALLLWLFVLGTFFAKAQTYPAIPNPPRLVNDFAGMLTAEERESLENRLVAYDDSTSTQIAIVTEQTLNGADAGQYAIGLFNAWGIGGQKKADNGVLIYVALNDRKMFIVTGRGVEEYLPDIVCKRIVERKLKPNFRNENYYEGFSEAIDEMQQRLAGTFINDEADDAEGLPMWAVILIIIILIIVFSSMFGGGGGGTYSRRGYSNWGSGPVIFSGGGGGWSSGGGGGGFGGFGGGSSGGGGAGGSW
ncbi:MAG: TPM domain-containing protein [Bacteroidetes bacterium]|nr:TPM domain-containing protein [Bacteroidota bacterium]